MTTAEAVQQYIALTRIIDETKEELKVMNKERDQLQAAILAAWDLDGTHSTKTKRGETVYVSRHLSAKVVDKEALRDYMNETDNAAMLNVHTGTLKSYLRERMQHPKTGDWETSRLPADLQGIVMVSEYHKLGARGIK